MGTQKKKAGGHKKPIGQKATGASSSKEDMANDSEDGEGTLSSVVMEMNRKKKKSGGFQSMGLDYPVYKGVIKKGYKVPTPIQRKTIPLILQVSSTKQLSKVLSDLLLKYLLTPFLYKSCMSSWEHR